MPSAAKNLQLSTQRAKDLVRSIDDLETRPDIAQDTLGYLGVSMGAAEGAIYMTLAQGRLRTAVFLTADSSSTRQRKARIRLTLRRA